MPELRLPLEMTFRIADWEIVPNLLTVGCPDKTRQQILDRLRKPTGQMSPVIRKNEYTYIQVR